MDLLQLHHALRSFACILVSCRLRQGFMYILQQEKEERIRREQEEPKS